MTPPLIQIRVNGEPRAVTTGWSLTDLVASLRVPPQAALIEHNGQALLRSEWTERVLAEDDRVEILRVVAGG